MVWRAQSGAFFFNRIKRWILGDIRVLDMDYWVRYKYSNSSIQVNCVSCSIYSNRKCDKQKTENKDKDLRTRPRIGTRTYCLTTIQELDYKSGRKRMGVIISTLIGYDYLIILTSKLSLNR